MKATELTQAGMLIILPGCRWHSHVPWVMCTFCFKIREADRPQCICRKCKLLQQLQEPSLLILSELPWSPLQLRAAPCFCTGEMACRETVQCRNFMTGTESAYLTTSDPSCCATFACLFHLPSVHP